MVCLPLQTSLDALAVVGRGMMATGSDACFQNWRLRGCLCQGLCQTLHHEAVLTAVQYTAYPIKEALKVHARGYYGDCTPRALQGCHLRDGHHKRVFFAVLEKAVTSAFGSAVFLKPAII